MAAKNIINLILVLTIWCCSSVKSSLVLLEEGVCYDQCVLLANSFSLCPLHFILQGQISLLFTWGQTMVEVMKIMATSFKKSHECNAILSAPNPEAGHHQAMPLETPGHSQASLGQSPVGSLLPSPGSWCTRFCLCPPRVFFPICLSSGSSMTGLMATSS